MVTLGATRWVRPEAEAAVVRLEPLGAGYDEPALTHEP
jgi:hypothetical protein